MYQIVLFIALLFSLVVAPTSYAQQQLGMSCDARFFLIGQSSSININDILNEQTISSRIKTLVSCPANAALSCDENAQLLCDTKTTQARTAKVVVGSVNDLKDELNALGIPQLDVSKLICKDNKQVSVVGATNVGIPQINFGLQCCSGTNVNSCTTLEQAAAATATEEVSKLASSLCADSCKANKDAQKLKCSGKDVYKCCPGGTPVCLPVGTATKLVKNLSDPNFTAKLSAGDPTAIKDLGQTAGELARTVRCGNTGDGGGFWSTVGGILGAIAGAFIGPVGASLGSSIGSGIGSLAYGLFSPC